MFNASSSKIWEKFPELKKIPSQKFPKHLLIIPDGNGRWAQKINKVPIIGHRQGFKVLKKLLENLQELPIYTVTIWGFAADNWKRSKKEITDLMLLFKEALKETTPVLLKNNRRFIHLGRKDRIPLFLKKTIEDVENKTRNNKEKILCLAIDFGGEDQEIRIMKKIQKMPKNIDITIDLLNRQRDGNGEISPADLIIRTSGENRTSDIGWLGKNSEFYSIPKLLPDTTLDDFVLAIADYSKRERRFGARQGKNE